MEVALNNYLGPNDIQIGSWTESLRGNGEMNRKAILDTFFSPVSIGNTLKQLIVSKFTKKGADFPRIVNTSIKLCYQKKLGINPACPTAESVKQFDPDAWKNYFKFAFARNPFDFEISDYFWRTRDMNQKIEFKEFLERKLKTKEDPENLIPFPSTNWPIYSINNKVVLDYVGIFENLKDHLSFIGERLGLPIDVNILPTIKRNTKKPFDFKNLYDQETTEMVYALHKNEFDYFGFVNPYKIL